MINLKNFPPRVIAQTGVSVSPVTLGTVKCGRNQNMKYPSGYSLPSDEDMLSLLDLAQDLGITTLDTAPAYGTSEERLGQVLGKRIKHWTVCTKVGEEFANGQSSFDFSASHLIASVHRSLKRLNLDTLDVVMLHCDDNDIHIIQNTAALATLHQLKQQGLIRAIGASTKTVGGALAALPHVDCLMVTYNQNYTDEEPVLNAAKTMNKGIFIKKALASGHLVHHDAQGLADALGFVVRHPAVTSVTLGTLSPDHLRANVAAVAMELAKQGLITSADQ